MTVACHCCFSPIWTEQRGSGQMSCCFLDLDATHRSSVPKGACWMRWGRVSMNGILVVAFGQ